MDLHPSSKNEILLQKTVAGKDDGKTPFSTLPQKYLKIGNDGSSFMVIRISRALLQIIFQHVDDNDCRFHEGSYLLKSFILSFPWKWESRRRSRESRKE